jgi:hypothetical protein
VPFLPTPKPSTFSYPESLCDINGRESSGGSVAGAASAPTTFDFVIPVGGVKAGMKPRHAVQLVDAPLGGEVSFVFDDPSGRVRAYLATVNKPLKVIGVGGTFR